MSCLGLDIGGANLKTAHSDGWARSAPFPLWRNPQGLPAALHNLLSGAPAADRLAVTMTGELCDCFTSKADGVRHILGAVGQITPTREVRVYLTDGTFATVPEALAAPQLAAASNWRALAEFACRYFKDRSGLLIDIGSTTTDIIPVVGGRVVARGKDDTERLASGELVYSGVGRTPVCAIAHLLPWRDTFCPVAAEFFATTADAYVILGQIAEDTSATWTADGRPLTLECSKQRLARQICTDASNLTADELTRMASFVRGAQLAQIKDALINVVEAMAEPPRVIVLSGNGEFLGIESELPGGVRVPQIRLSAVLGAELSKCAPAYATARLAAEEF